MSETETGIQTNDVARKDRLDLQKGISEID